MRDYIYLANYLAKSVLNLDASEAVSKLSAFLGGFKEANAYLKTSLDDLSKAFLKGTDESLYESSLSGVLNKYINLVQNGDLNKLAAFLVMDIQALFEPSLLEGKSIKDYISESTLSNLAQVNSFVNSKLAASLASKDAPANELTTNLQNQVDMPALDGSLPMPINSSDVSSLAVSQARDYYAVLASEASLEKALNEASLDKDLINSAIFLNQKALQSAALAYSQAFKYASVKNLYGDEAALKLAALIQPSKEFQKQKDELDKVLGQVFKEESKESVKEEKVSVLEANPTLDSSLKELDLAKKDLLDKMQSFDKTNLVKDYEKAVLDSILESEFPTDKEELDRQIQQNALKLSKAKQDFEKSESLLKAGKANFELLKAADDVMFVLLGGSVGKLGSYSLKDINDSQNLGGHYQPTLYAQVANAINKIQNGNEYYISTDESTNSHKSFIEPIDKNLLDDVLNLVITSLHMGENDRIHYTPSTTVSDVHAQIANLKFSLDVDPSSKVQEKSIGYKNGELDFKEPGSISFEYAKAKDNFIALQGASKALELLKGLKNEDELALLQVKSKDAFLKAKLEVTKSSLALQKAKEKLVLQESKLKTAKALDLKDEDTLGKEAFKEALKQEKVFISKAYDLSSKDDEPLAVEVSSTDSHGKEFITKEQAKFVFFPISVDGEILMVGQRLNPDTYIKKVDIGSGKIMDEVSYIETNSIKTPEDVKVEEYLGLKFLVSNAHDESYGKVLGSVLGSHDDSINYTLAYAKDDKGSFTLALKNGDHIPGMAVNAYTNPTYSYRENDPITPPKPNLLSSLKTKPTWNNVIMQDARGDTVYVNTKNGISLVDDFDNSGLYLQYGPNGFLTKVWNDPSKEGFLVGKDQEISFDFKVLAQDLWGKDHGGIPNLVFFDEGGKMHEINMDTKDTLSQSLSVVNTGDESVPLYVFATSFENNILKLNKLQDGSSVEIDLNPEGKRPNGAYEINPSYEYKLSLITHTLLAKKPGVNEWEKVPLVSITIKSPDGKDVKTYYTGDSGADPSAEATLPMTKKDGEYHASFGDGDFYYKAADNSPHEVSVKIEKNISTKNTAFKIFVDGVVANSGSMEYTAPYTSTLTHQTSMVTQYYQDFDPNKELKLVFQYGTLKTKSYATYKGDSLDLSSLRTSPMTEVSLEIENAAIKEIKGSSGNDTISLTDGKSIVGASVDEATDHLNISGDKIEFLDLAQFAKIKAKDLVLNSFYDSNYDEQGSVLSVINAAGFSGKDLKALDTAAAGPNAKIVLNKLGANDTDFSDFVAKSSDCALVLNYDVNLISPLPKTTLVLSNMAIQGGVQAPDIISLPAFTLANKGLSESYLNLVLFQAGDKLSFKIANATLGTKGSGFDNAMAGIVATGVKDGKVLLEKGQSSKDFAKALEGAADVGVENGVYLVYGDDGVSLVAQGSGANDLNVDIIHLGLAGINSIEVDASLANKGMISLLGESI